MNVLNPFKNTEAKLPNWVCSTNIPRLGGNPFLVLRPDGMLRRIADPCQAQLRSHKLDSTSEAPKDWILLETVKLDSICTSLRLFAIPQSA
jgi:hypothetical protein